MKRPDLFAPLPVGFFRHPKTYRVRDVAGPLAPLAFLVLVAEETVQSRHGGPAGEVKMTPADLALCIGSDGFNLLATLDALASVGWLEVITKDAYECHVRLLNAAEWGPKDPTGAERQRRHRERLAAATSTVQAVGGRDSHRDVTPGNAEEKREEEKEYAPEVRRLSHLLADLLTARDDKARVGPDTKAWLDPVRLLLDRDGRSVEDVERVIRWCQGDAFWQNVIRSTANLRKHFDKLYAAAGLARPITAGGLSALDKALGG